MRHRLGLRDGGRDRGDAVEEDPRPVEHVGERGNGSPSCLDHEPRRDQEERDCRNEEPLPEGLPADRVVPHRVRDEDAQEAGSEEESLATRLATPHRDPQPERAEDEHGAVEEDPSEGRKQVQVEPSDERVGEATEQRGGVLVGLLAGDEGVAKGSLVVEGQEDDRHGPSRGEPCEAPREPGEVASEGVQKEDADDREQGPIDVVHRQGGPQRGAAGNGGGQAGRPAARHPDGKEDRQQVEHRGDIALEEVRGERPAYGREGIAERDERRGLLGEVHRAQLEHEVGRDGVTQRDEELGEEHHVPIQGELAVQQEPEAHEGEREDRRARGERAVVVPFVHKVVHGLRVELAHLPQDDGMVGPERVRELEEAGGMVG